MAAADMSLLEAADAFCAAAVAHDAGQLSRLEYLRARQAFRAARAVAMGVVATCEPHGPAQVICLSKYRSTRRVP